MKLIKICFCSYLVLQAFKLGEVIPDVVSSTPKQLLHVKWRSGAEARLGNELTPTEVREKPIIDFAADPYAYYTLIMTDPDAPSRKNPARREWHHWLVVNVPGAQIEKGETLTDYIGSAPPDGSGLHRYVLLAYKQPFRLTFNERYISNRDGNRGNFSTKNFAYKYKLGEPVAGNYYQAKYDDSVPETQRQLSSA